MNTPSFLQSQPWQSVQAYANTVPGMFANTGIGRNTRAVNQQTFDSGSAIAAAAANRYVQTQRQNGGSTAGAGFAQASAMLPVYGQIAQNNLDLSKLRLQSRGMQAQIGAGLAGDVGKLQGDYQSTLAQYLLNKQRLEQSDTQFGQNLDLQKQQLAQQGQLQNRQLGNQSAQLALQYAPRGVGSYSLNNMGSPMDINSAAAYNNSQTQQSYLQAILGGLGYGGIGTPNFATRPMGGLGVSSGVYA